MMEQCNAGGFNAPVLAASTADNTTIASAAIATQSSWASPDGNWDSFARDWIAGQMGHDPYGAALANNPDTNGDGAIEADEAFNYAVSIQNPSDSPVLNSSAAGASITLAQHYTLIWLWCWIIHPIMVRYIEKFPPPPPDPESIYERIQEMTPELQKLVIPALDRTTAELRKELGPKVEGLVKAAFEMR
jgi:hypothetical protein